MKLTSVCLFILKSEFTHFKQTGLDLLHHQSVSQPLQLIPAISFLDQLAVLLLVQTGISERDF